MPLFVFVLSTQAITQNFKNIHLLKAVSFLNYQQVIYWLTALCTCQWMWTLQLSTQLTNTHKNRVPHTLCSILYWPKLSLLTGLNQTCSVSYNIMDRSTSVVSLDLSTGLSTRFLMSTTLWTVSTNANPFPRLQVKALMPNCIPNNSSFINGISPPRYYLTSFKGPTISPKTYLGI